MEGVRDVDMVVRRYIYLNLVDGKRVEGGRGREKGKRRRGRGRGRRRERVRW